MIAIPPDSDIRMFRDSGQWFVAITRGPAIPSLANLAVPGSFSCLITHDADMSWPDRDGERLASAALVQSDGAVFLAFDSLADALQCRERALAERSRLT